MKTTAVTGTDSKEAASEACDGKREGTAGGVGGVWGQGGGPTGNKLW